ncbi:hypothetical protein N7510_003137 [Penicillium lagena]|uniref:uncharacterized protein n=1 Tax=Penicillium lagena TaxID=94218 RepID=UPI00253F8C46|nr:uncharacterized protein N7510_003137 [Penicillium lagena]KAJ5619153.1 hypothetical protein N7510_003137 [Penicillium lagena]
MASKRNLSSWSWRDGSGLGLSGQTEIPTNIHLDLLAANLIPDPFVGTNEADLQWIHRKSWVYTTTFEAPSVPENENLDLVFEGLDTFATVQLNGQEILKCENMFISHRLDIKHLIRPQNHLEIFFESAYDRAEALRAERGELICWNGHYGRVYVRKAQYHFGWDWGPSLVTCGPWKTIYLEQYSCRIEEMKIDVGLSSDLKKATLTVDVNLEPRDISRFIEVEFRDPEGTVLDRQTTQSRSVTFLLDQPKLWYPHTHGDQPLYQFVAIVRSGRDVLDSKTHNIGIRQIELIQSPLQEGSSFYFKCNGIPMFMGGSNWIPGDQFLPRMTTQRYIRWVDLAVRGNQNMLRIWGGGIYEEDVFYDECDRRGILVWQDFCFACGQYPSDEEFIGSVKEEARQAIKRLRSHPSLAIWAGNNEDYQVANEALHHDMTMPEDQWSGSTFGARVIYEKVLPDLVKEHAPGSIYWPGSPFGGVDNNSDRTVGDGHIWNVSSGMLLPYQRYPDITGRFVSEFGMPSCPAVETVMASFFGESDDRNPQSEAFEFHCKMTSYEKRMFTCMGENLRMSFDLDAYVYLSQLVQSEAMHYAFRGWRRRFEGRECGGALVWQMNDSWPVVSWAIADYHERPKMAYYVIARDMKNLAIGIERKPKINPKPNLQHEAFCRGKTKADSASVIAHATPHIYPAKESSFYVWVANAAVNSQQADIRIRFISVRTGLEVRNSIVSTVTAKGTGTHEVANGSTPETEPTVVVSELYDQDGKLLAHDVDWPQPLKHLRFPQRGLKVEVHRQEELVVSVARPVKGLFFTNDGVQWSDNCLDVAPGQTLTVIAKGLKESPKWVYYGMDD